MDDQSAGGLVEEELELTLRQRRRDALLQDVVLFCSAFTLGAVVYAIGRAVFADSATFWSIGLSDDLILSGLIAGELFLLWNNGVRQGVRGHSIGKHRLGLRVVDASTGELTGPWRGLLRGAVMAVLLDLAVAAIPIGLPTAARRLTPDDWHVGAVVYLALILLIVPLFLPTTRGVADLVARTTVEEADGEGATTSRSHRHALWFIDLAGVVGVLIVLALYLHFFWPLIWRFPSLG